MCKYEMDPSSIVADTGRTRFCQQTDRRTRDGHTDGRTDGQGGTSMHPFNFVEARSMINSFVFRKCLFFKSISSTALKTLRWHMQNMNMIFQYVSRVFIMLKSGKISRTGIFFSSYSTQALMLVGTFEKNATKCDDVMALKLFSRYWHFVRRIRWLPVGSPKKRPSFQSFEGFFDVGLHKILIQTVE